MSEYGGYETLASPVQVLVIFISLGCENSASLKQKVK